MTMTIITPTADCGCEDCQPHALARNNYFTGKLMVERDFTDEQWFFREKIRLHHQRLHGTGIVCGLEVKPASRTPTARTGSCCWSRARRSTAAATTSWWSIRRSSTSPSAGGAGADPGNDAKPHELEFCLVWRECPTEEVPVLYDECGCDDTQCAPNRILESFAIEVRVDPPRSSRRICMRRISMGHQHRHRACDSGRARRGRATRVRRRRNRRADAVSGRRPAPADRDEPCARARRCWTWRSRRTGKRSTWRLGRTRRPGQAARALGVHAGRRRHRGGPPVRTAALGTRRRSRDRAVGRRRWAASRGRHHDRQSLAVCGRCARSDRRLRRPARWAGRAATGAVLLGRHDGVARRDGRPHGRSASSVDLTTDRAQRDSGRAWPADIVTAVASSGIAGPIGSPCSTRPPSRCYLVDRVAETIGSAILADTPVSRAGHARWRDGDRLERGKALQPVDLGALANGATNPAGARFSVPGDDRPRADHRLRPRLFVPFSGTRDRGSGAVAVIELSDTRLPRRPARPRLPAVRRAGLPGAGDGFGWQVGFALQDPTDPPSDPAADAAASIARIDNEARTVLRSTQAITEALLCLMDHAVGGVPAGRACRAARSPGAPGPPGARAYRGPDCRPDGARSDLVGTGDQAGITTTRRRSEFWPASRTPSARHLREPVIIAFSDWCNTNDLRPSR